MGPAEARSKRGIPRAKPVPRAYPEPVERLIDAFSSMPGIGRRSAERLAFHVLTSPEGEALRLARAVEDVKRSVRHCAECYNLSDHERCSICADPARDQGKILVVEQPKDLIALEQTGMYKGVYHVLMGRISPLEGITPANLTIAGLIKRARARPDVEIILGLNPTLEGDGTALYLAEQLSGVRLTRLARGLPSGTSLEYANKAVLADAILGRIDVR